MAIYRIKYSGSVLVEAESEAEALLAYACDDVKPEEHRVDWITVFAPGGVVQE